MGGGDRGDGGSGAGLWGRSGVDPGLPLNSLGRKNTGAHCSRLKTVTALGLAMEIKAHRFQLLLRFECPVRLLGSPLLKFGVLLAA